MSSVNNSQKKDVDQIEGPWSPEEDEMLQILFEKHFPNWSLISKSIPGRSDQSCRIRWFTLKCVRLAALEDKTRLENNSATVVHLHEDITIGAHNVNIPLPFFSGRGQGSSYVHDGNLSHEVGGVSGQAPSISDMARGNMSSGGTHSYSRDHSAPSWNALYIRASSPMMIDSDSVHQFVGGEFGPNEYSEVSSKSAQGKGW